MKVKHMNNIYNNPFETEQQRRQRLERERWQNGSRQPQSFTSSNTTAAPAWHNNYTYPAGLFQDVPARGIV